ncbi:MAG: hypothetical protein ACFCUQ_21150 [Kiloniellales bacterium]
MRSGKRESRRDALDRELRSAASTPALRLHPGLSGIYRREVELLEAALNDESIKAESAEMLRALIARIELLPRADGASLDALLYGELAAIPVFCAEVDGKRRNSPERMLRGVKSRSLRRHATTYYVEQFSLGDEGTQAVLVVARIVLRLRSNSLES